MKIKINITKGKIFFFSALALILIGTIGTSAYGTSNPSAFGHSGEEVEVSFRGNPTTVNDALSILESEIVTWDCQANLAFYSSSNPGDTQTGYVSCPSDRKLVGGSCESYNGGSVEQNVVIYDHPELIGNEIQWKCKAPTLSGNFAYTVKAICCK